MDSSMKSPVKRESADVAEDSNEAKKMRIASSSPDPDEKIDDNATNAMITTPVITVMTTTSVTNATTTAHVTTATTTAPVTSTKAISPVTNATTTTPVTTATTIASVTNATTTTPVTTVTTIASVTNATTTAPVARATTTTPVTSTKTTASITSAKTAASVISTKIVASVTSTKVVTSVANAKAFVTASNKSYATAVPSVSAKTGSQFNDRINGQVFSYEKLTQFDKSVVKKIMRMNEFKASLNNEIFKVDASKNDFRSHFFSESIIKEAINDPAIYNGLSNTAKTLILKACEFLLIEISAFSVAHAQEKNKLVVENDDLLHFLCHTEQYDFMCAQVYEKQ